MNEAPVLSSEQREANTPAWVTTLAKGGWRSSLLLFLLLTGFYLVTAAGNAGETDDVYAFAYRAENFSAGYLSDPRLMLYHLSMRLLFVATGSLGLDISALILMRGFSAVCAAASLLLLMRIAVLDLKLSATTAILTAVILGSCYGFWRYAAEAEVYIPAILLILLVFHGLSRSLEGVGAALAVISAFAGWGLLAGLSVLFYQPSVVPLFFAFPVLLLYRTRILHLSFYLAAGGAVVAGGYLIGFLVFWPEPLGVDTFKVFLSQRADEFIVPPFSLRTVFVSMIRSAFALGHDFASVNWIFAFDPIVKLVQQAFSSNVITEEVFLAKRAGALVYLPIITLSALTAISLGVLKAIWRPSIAFLKRRPFLVVLLWAAINGAIIGRLNPAGLEAWIMVFPPLVILFAVGVIEPCIKRGNISIVIAFAAALFLHNAVGGMALVWDPANEYDRATGSWVIAEAQPQDLVIVSGNAGLVEAMRYLSPAKVALIGAFQAPGVSQSLLEGDTRGLFTRTRGRDFDDFLLRDLIQETWNTGGRLIFFDGFFKLPKGVKLEDWPEFNEVKALRDRLQKVYDAPDVGATYLLAAPIK
ncbi:hypothetical protein [Pelagibius sp. Alg239-R121]|uniref:hypothetical protein n=1 Tax=Pelagibius sp. Alg239-R121 TaxID=2993448 RepID=UPI0024A799C1|nr:hypothetical protein [Pelagibius sp. Alg239-R121]